MGHGSRGKKAKIRPEEDFGCLRCKRIDWFRVAEATIERAEISSSELEALIAWLAHNKAMLDLYYKNPLAAVQAFRGQQRPTQMELPFESR